VGKLNPGDKLHAILNGTNLTLEVDVV
jgi:hypothetical protein